MSKRPIYTFDFETDPFLIGRIPEPFACGVYGQDYYQECWADDPQDVIMWILDQLDKMPKGSIAYAHNGGKFDFHFFKEHFDLGDLKIINARIAKLKVRGIELRDSFLMIPVPLSAHKKDDIEYWKLERDVRDQYREEILSYMKADCVYLHELVTGFIDEFGISLTMASAAMREMSKFYDVDKIPSEQTDKQFRQYYYGGRVQCFEKGILHGNFKVYDVNSMYPSVMRNYQHPISSNIIVYHPRHYDAALEHCDFIMVEGWNDNALPSRAENYSLDFTREFGVFHVTGHELRAALKLGRFRIHKIHEVYKSEQSTNFAEFIDHFFELRQQAKSRGDKLHDLFYKLIMNSSYGKYAQNPDNFKDWCIVDDEILGDGWLPEVEFDNGLIIYSRPTVKPLYLFRYNVMTAASITGAARAELLLGLSNAVRPVYCDTDSVICESLNADLDDRELGKWALEASGNRLAVAGKKMYCLWDNEVAVKTASKGVRLSAEEITSVARGDEIQYRNDAPTFSLTKDTRFIERRVRMT
jgi:hypothetical protein